MATFAATDVPAAARSGTESLTTTAVRTDSDGVLALTAAASPYYGANEERHEED